MTNLDTSPASSKNYIFLFNYVENQSTKIVNIVIYVIIAKPTNFQNFEMNLNNQGCAHHYFNKLKCKSFHLILTVLVLSQLCANLMLIG